MAKRKPAPKPKIPQTAAEKEARVSLTIARQLGLSQTRAKQASSGKGAYRERQLRAAGDMTRYNLARFKDDPFPQVAPTSGPTVSSGGRGVASGPAGGRGARTSPRPRRAAPTGRREVTADLTPGPSRPRLPSTNDGQLANREKMAEERARQKAEAAKRAAARKKATATNKELGTYRAPTRSTMTAM